MEITIQPQAAWDSKKGATHVNMSSKWLSMIDGQEQNRALWYIVSLMAQGVLFLPVPAAMIYYYNASLLLLPVTLALFFANIIAGMGGAGIRVILYLFLISVVAHLVMLAYYLV